MAENTEAPKTVKKVPLLHFILISVVLLGASTMVLKAYHQFVESEDAGIQKALQEDERYNMSLTHVEPLDKLVKIVHLVFTKQFLLKDINYWVLEWWFMACLTLVFFQSIDFDRLGMRFVPFYMFFYQYVSIGVCWPLVMIYYMWKRNQHSGRFQGGSAPSRVICMGVALLITAALMASLSQLSYLGDVFFWTVHLFLLVPVVLPLFTYLSPSETAPRSHYESALGQRFENICYAFFAGISFLMYWRWLPAFIEQYGLPVNLAFFAAAWNDLVATPAQVFLLHDLLSSFIVIIIFIYMDGGILASLFMILASPLVSPTAALCIYLLYRESFIYGTSTGQWSTKVHASPPTKKHQ